MNGDFYLIRYHENFETLIEEFENAVNIPANVLPSPSIAGTRADITFSFGMEADRYFAIITQTQDTDNNGTLYVKTIIKLRVLKEKREK